MHQRIFLIAFLLTGSVDTFGQAPPSSEKPPVAEVSDGVVEFELNKEGDTASESAAQAPSAPPQMDFTNKTLEDQKREYLRKNSELPRDLRLFFDPRENGVEFPPQIVEYDLTGGEVLRLGPLTVPAFAVSIQLTREAKPSESIFSLSGEAGGQVYVASFNWPVEYLPDGVIEIIDQDNQVQWRKNLSDEDVWRWSAQMEKVRGKGRVASYRNLRKEAFLKNLRTEWGETGDSTARVSLPPRQFGAFAKHGDSQFGLIGKEFLDTGIWRLKKPFRFCLTKESDEGRLVICSKRYKVVKRNDRFEVVFSKAPVLPRVLVNDKPVTLKGSAIFVDDRSPIKFSALTSDGTFFEFISRPKPLNILDMHVEPESQLVSVIGYGHPPMGAVNVIRRENPDFWNFLNFMPTIGDFREFWRATFSVNSPFLYLSGYGGAPFKQNFYFKDLPSEKNRVRLDPGSYPSTYAQTVKLNGTRPESVKVSSRQAKARNVGKDRFEWTFLSNNRGEYNRSYLAVQDGEQTWKAYYEVYKGYPLELSTRLTGVLSNTLSVILLGEVAGQYWFEDFFGWKNKTLALQRWGVAAKYFQTLGGFGGKSPVPEDGQEATGKTVKLNVLTADLKYRLSPGVWGRDPTVGLMLSGQRVTIESYSATLLGAGAFWARSMPKFFDGLFNWVPFLDYPKWVDMEFIFYGLSPEAHIQPNANLAMNFHGKVQWTKRFFGEAGFGLKVFSFNDIKQQKGVGLGVAYGTMGIGYNF